MIVDIKGITISICMHHIYMKEGTKLMRDVQLHLNPSMIEVVKNKVTRLLDYEYL